MRVRRPDVGTHEGEARISIITSTTGGVMTEEVGAITGELEVATRLSGEGLLEAAVRYAGADEWYTVKGSPSPPDVETSNNAPAELLHERVVTRLATPGVVVNGNEMPVSLEV